MGCFLARGVPISPAVTPREYLDAVNHALDSLSHERERRGAPYTQALEDLVGGRAVRAACVFSLLLDGRPDDPTLHRMLGTSYFRAGNARLAVRHLKTALMLLGRATTPGMSLFHSLRIEFEASVVRLALTAAYERLGHRGDVIRCLLAQNQPLAWGIHRRPRV
jgi:hypothetical protein